MKKLYIARDIAELYYVKGLIESQGIACKVINESLYSLRGELPVTEETAPTLCILDDAQFTAARDVIADYEKANRETNTDTANWVCKVCGEESEGQFSECWNCLNPRT